MKRGNTVAAIDIGSTKVTVIVADLNEYGETSILGVGIAPAAGLSRGVIDNIQSAREAVANAVAKAERSCGMQILSGVVGISGGHLSSQNNRGIVAIPDRSEPISIDDRERAIDAAGQISIPTNRQVLHVLPRAYWVEGTQPVSDPVGMYGGRLDAETHIVTGATSAIQNLTKCVEAAGVQVDDIVLESFASATAVLTQEERNQGVAAVDIGGSTTSLCVFDDGAVAHSSTLPLAGTHLTDDLARVLRCPWESAERVKCEHGAALPTVDMEGEQIEVRAFGSQSQKSVLLTHIAEILQARTEEILEMVAIELKRSGYLDRLAAGLVLTGGSSQLRHIAELSEQRLELPARVGNPSGCVGLTDLITTPAFATSVGLVEHALGDDRLSREYARSRLDRQAGGVLRRIANIGRALIPQ